MRQLKYIMIYLAIVIVSSFAYTDIAKASPFSDRMKQRYCLTQALYYEDAAGTTISQFVVADSITNRMRRTGKSVCEVVWAKKQYSFTHDGKPDGVPTNRVEFEAWQEMVGLAEIVMQRKTAFISPCITHYHAVWMEKPKSWDKQYFIERIGGHIAYGTNDEVCTKGELFPQRRRMF